MTEGDSESVVESLSPEDEARLVLVCRLILARADLVECGRIVTESTSHLSPFERERFAGQVWGHFLSTITNLLATHPVGEAIEASFRDRVAFYDLTVTLDEPDTDEIS